MEVVNVNGTDYQLKEWFDSNSYGKKWAVRKLKKVSPGMWDKLEILGWFSTKHSALEYLKEVK
tara:strand:+ start:4497 stop:4685 length:189 start_codon:yes stop_codon:yes gene_type:complete